MPSPGRSLAPALVLTLGWGTSGGCVGPAPPPPQSTEMGGTTGQPGTTGDPGSGDAQSTGTTTDAPSTGSTTEPSTTSGGIDTEGSSTGPMRFSFDGSYEGSWEGLCLGIEVFGEFMIEVDEMGTLTGMLIGIENDGLVGTVNPMGEVMATTMAELLSECSFEAQIGPMGELDGTWTCTMFDCEGTWAGSMPP